MLLQENIALKCFQNVLNALKALKRSLLTPQLQDAAHGPLNSDVSWLVWFAPLF